MNRGIILALLVVSVPLHSHAGDLIQLPLGNSAQSVEITYQEGAGASASSPNGTPAFSSAKGTSANVGSRPVKATITTVNDIRCTQITWSDGKTTSRWGLQSRGLTVTNSPVNNSIYVISNSDPLLLSYGRVPFDASDFAWVTPGTLVSTEPVDYGGKTCFHYKGSVRIPLGRKQVIDEKVETWIEKTSLLPVALQEGSTLYAYTFLPPPPPTPLVMPPDFQAALDRVIATSTPPRVIGTFR